MNNLLSIGIVQKFKQTEEWSIVCEEIKYIYNLNILNVTILIN